MLALLIGAVCVVWLIGQFFSTVAAVIVAAIFAMILFIKIFDTAPVRKAIKAVQKNPRLVIIPCGIVALICFVFLAFIFFST